STERRRRTCSRSVGWDRSWRRRSWARPGTWAGSPRAPGFGSYAGTAPIPASSGTVIRHRLDRGGNRQLNRALHTVALTQARRDDRAKAFLARKRGEGKTPRDARRALKRHLADAVYRALLLDAEGARSIAA